MASVGWSIFGRGTRRAISSTSHRNKAVTLNLKDFPTDKLDSAGLEAISPDQAALIIEQQSPNDVRNVLRKQRAALRQPPISRPVEFMKRISIHLPQLADLLTIEAVT